MIFRAQDIFAFLFLAALVPELTLAKHWGVLFSPLTWTRDNVIGNPMKMGSQLRTFVDAGGNEKNVYTHELGQNVPEIQYITEVIDSPAQLQTIATEERPSGLMNFLFRMLRPRIYFENVSAPATPAPYVNLDSKLGLDEPVVQPAQQEVTEAPNTEDPPPNLPEEVPVTEPESDPEVVAPVQDETTQEEVSKDDEISPESSADLPFVEENPKPASSATNVNWSLMTSSLQKGRPFFDGKNLAVRFPGKSNVPPTENIGRVAFVDLAHLQPFMDGKTVVVFTGLGSNVMPSPAPKEAKIRTQHFAIGSVIKDSSGAVISTNFAEPVSNLTQLDGDLTYRSDELDSANPAPSPYESDLYQSSATDGKQPFETEQSHSFDTQENQLDHQPAPESHKEIPLESNGPMSTSIEEISETVQNIPEDLFLPTDTPVDHSQGESFQSITSGQDDAELSKPEIENVEVVGQDQNVIAPNFPNENESQKIIEHEISFEDSNGGNHQHTLNIPEVELLPEVSLITTPPVITPVENLPVPSEPEMPSVDVTERSDTPSFPVTLVTSNELVATTEVPFKSTIQPPSHPETTTPSGDAILKRQGDTDPKHHMFQQQVLGLSPYLSERMPESEPSQSLEEEDPVESRGGVEGYLEYLRREQDGSNCISLLICEVSTNPERYGQEGYKTAKFFREHRFTRKNRFALWYKTVFRMGNSVKSLPMCRSTFRPCSSTTSQLKDLGRKLLFSALNVTL